MIETLKTKMWVDEKSILKNAGAFFTSPRSVPVEFVQNAYRSGATDVKIFYDFGTQDLRILDNGSGADWNNIIGAGSTSYETDYAKDPAGLGCFSALAPGMCTSIVYRSKDWRMELTSASVASEIEVVTGLPDIVGTEVTIYGIKLHETDIPFARSLYPINFYYNDEVLPPLALGRELIDVFDSPYGKVEIWKKNRKENVSDYSHLNGNSCIGVWQHQILGFEPVYYHIRQTLNDTAWGREVLQNYNFSSDGLRIVVYIDPDSGVTPRLPDRLHISESEKCQEVGQEIAYSFAEKIKSCFPGELPDRAVRCPSSQVRKFLMSLSDNSKLAQEVVDSSYSSIAASLGYIHICVEDFLCDSYSVGGDSYEIDTSTVNESYYTREDFLVSEDEALLASLFYAGHSATRFGYVNRFTHPRMESNFSIQYDSLNVVGDVAFVKNLKVFTAGGKEYKCPPILYLCEDHSVEYGIGHPVVAITTFSEKQFLKLFNNDHDFKDFLMCVMRRHDFNNERYYMDDDGEEVNFNESGMITDLIKPVSDAVYANGAKLAMLIHSSNVLKERFDKVDTALWYYRTNSKIDLYLFKFFAWVARYLREFVVKQEKLLSKIQNAYINDEQNWLDELVCKFYLMFYIETKKEN